MSFAKLNLFKYRINTINCRYLKKIEFKNHFRFFSSNVDSINNRNFELPIEDDLKSKPSDFIKELSNRILSLNIMEYRQLGHLMQVKILINQLLAVLKFSILKERIGFY